MDQKIAFKVYQNKKAGGRVYHIVKYRVAAGKWASKQAPSHLTTIAEIEAWFPGWSEAQQRLQQLNAQTTHNIVKQLQEKHPTLTIEAKGKAIVAHVPDNYAGEPTLGNLADKWLLYRETTSPDRMKDLRSHIDTWVRGQPIAKVQIAKLEPKVCRDWIRSIPRAPLTVRNVVATVRTLVDDARKEGWVSWQTINPFRERAVLEAINNGQTVSKKHGEENTVVPTSEQVSALLRVEDSERRLRYWVACGTGLRQSELAGLQVRDIDLVRRTLTVERQWQPGTKQQVKPPKKKSYRTLPLHPSLLPMLSQAVEGNAASAFLLSREWHLSEKLREDLVAAGVSDKFIGLHGVEIPLDFHSLRRWFASALDSLNVDRAKIGALLGHKASGVTARNYLAKNLEVVRHEIERLNLG